MSDDQHGRNQPGRPRGFVFRPHERGCVDVQAIVDWEDVKALLSEVRSDTGGTARVVARSVDWAGPYEILLAITAVGGAVGGLAGGTAAVLGLFAKRHPDQTITIHVSDNRTVIIDGRELSASDQEAVNQFFVENSSDPQDASDMYDSGPGTSEV